MPVHIYEDRHHAVVNLDNGYVNVFVTATYPTRHWIPKYVQARDPQPLRRGADRTPADQLNPSG